MRYAWKVVHKWDTSLTPYNPVLFELGTTQILIVHFKSWVSFVFFFYHQSKWFFLSHFQTVISWFKGWNKYSTNILLRLSSFFCYDWIMSLIDILSSVCNNQCRNFYHCRCCNFCDRHCCYFGPFLFLSDEDACFFFSSLLLLSALSGLPLKVLCAQQPFCLLLLESFRYMFFFVVFYISNTSVILIFLMSFWFCRQSYVYIEKLHQKITNLCIG